MDLKLPSATAAHRAAPIAASSSFFPMFIFIWNLDSNDSLRIWFSLIPFPEPTSMSLFPAPRLIASLYDINNCSAIASKRALVRWPVVNVEGVSPDMAPFADGFFLDPVNKGSKITPSDPFGTVDANLTKFVYTESESISLELIDVIEFRKKYFVKKFDKNLTSISKIKEITTDEIIKNYDSKFKVIPRSMIKNFEI